MNSYQHYKKRARLVAAAAMASALLCAAPSVVSATVIEIDRFVTQQSVISPPPGLSPINGHAIAVLSAAPPAVRDTSSVAAFAIGDERDLMVEKTAGYNGDWIRARVNPNGLDLLRLSQDSGVRGITSVTWDGVDDSPALNGSGLGGIDFLIGASPRLELGILFADLAGPVLFEFFEMGDPTRFASSTIDIASASFPIVVDTVFTRALAAFDYVGGATMNSVFSNVGAIRMTLDGSGLAQTGWDLDLDYVQVRVPEPTSVFLLSIGLLGLGFGLQRRAS